MLHCYRYIRYTHIETLCTLCEISYLFANFVCYEVWEDNIKMDLQEVGGGCGDWMELAQDRDRWRALVNTVMKLRVPKMRGIS